MYSFYEVFVDLGNLGSLFFCGGGVLIFERIEIFWEGEGWWFLLIFRKVRVELFGWGEGDFFVCIHPYVKGYF